MPGYKGHIIGGIIFFLFALIGVIVSGLFILNPMNVVFLCSITLLGALFPDVDTDSKGQNLFYSVLVIVDFILIIKKYYHSAAILGFVALLPAIGHHRGWTHTWWAMLLVPAPILLLPMLTFDTVWYDFLPYYFAAVVGYFSHLFFDKVL